MPTWDTLSHNFLSIGRDEEFVMAIEQAEVKAKPTVTKSILSEREAELQQLLQWNLKCIKDSSVVCGAEDTDPIEVALALIHLASFFREQWHHEGQKLCTPLVDCTVKKSDFLGYLQDFMQRHFIGKCVAPCLLTEDSGCISCLHELYSVFEEGDCCTSTTSTCLST